MYEILVSGFGSLAFTNICSASVPVVVRESNYFSVSVWEYEGMKRILTHVYIF